MFTNQITRRRKIPEAVKPIALSWAYLRGAQITQNNGWYWITTGTLEEMAFIDRKIDDAIDICVLGKTSQHVAH